MVAERLPSVPELKDIRAERAERHLRDFIPQAWHVVEPSTRFLPNWHIDAICDHLEAVVRGEIRNLLVNMPPRMMKSLTVSVFFPAWRWLRAPETRFLYSSYSQMLATDHSLATRRVVESDWYQDRWGDRFYLAGDQNLKTRFENDKRGARVATSVGGTATGMGGDVVVVDDPHNVKEAESDSIREATLLWWDQVMSTRLNDPKTGARIIVMQRVHERDLAGHVLAQGGYVHLSLPMEYEPPVMVEGGVPEIRTENPLGWDDPRTEAGELLAPDRFGPDEVAQAKVRMGSYGYAGQMQQSPSPAEGGILKRWWWRFWQRPGMHLPPVRVKRLDGSLHECAVVDLPERFEQQIQSWDMAFKDTKASSFVVGQVWGAEQANRYLLDQTRGHLDFPSSVRAVQSTTAAWPETKEKLVEDKANGPAVVATLKDQIAGLIPVSPEGGKDVRAHAVSWQIESGNTYLPHPEIYPWVNDLIAECTKFPNGANDDQVDALTQALVRMGGKKPIPAVAPRGVGSAGTFNRLGGSS